jgi:hypothetical protein
MGNFGGYYKGERRKKKKELLEKEATRVIRIYTPPKIEIVGKKGKK